MSLPEVMLWQRLRGGATGMKFRRQHPVGPYVADFYCRDAGLIVEVDGEVHRDRLAHDAVRDEYLRGKGFEILRIAAVDVMKDADGVAEAIAARVANPLHHAAHGPPPRAGEDL